MSEAGRGARSVEDAACPHLLADEPVVRTLAVAGRAPGMQVLVRAKQRVGRAFEPLAPGVEELRSEIDLVHLSAPGARVAPHERPPQVPQSRRPHLAHAM